MEQYKRMIAVVRKYKLSTQRAKIVDKLRIIVTSATFRNLDKLLRNRYFFLASNFYNFR